MRELTLRNETLAHRIFAIRAELFGAGRAGLEAMAAALSLPPRTWQNYEAGVTMPATVMVRFLVLTGATARWLMTGTGERYFQRRPQSSDLPWDVAVSDRPNVG
jgi:hypothetical protein